MSQQPREKNRPRVIRIVIRLPVVAHAKRHQPQQPPVVVHRHQQPRPPQRQPVPHRQLRDRIRRTVPIRSVDHRRMRLQITHQRIVHREKRRPAIRAKPIRLAQKEHRVRRPQQIPRRPPELRDQPLPRIQIFDRPFDEIPQLRRIRRPDSARRRPHRLHPLRLFRQQLDHRLLLRQLRHQRQQLPQSRCTFLIRQIHPRPPRQPRLLERQAPRLAHVDRRTLHQRRRQRVLRRRIQHHHRGKSRRRPARQHHRSEPKRRAARRKLPLPGVCQSGVGGREDDEAGHEFEGCAFGKRACIISMTTPGKGRRCETTHRAPAPTDPPKWSRRDLPECHCKWRAPIQTPMTS